jgi:hypothetical protein
MGGGTYSSTARDARLDSLGVDYTSMSTAEAFTQREINNAMNPHGIKVRESRDSEEHPNSLAIILGLDVTGSMGSVPHFLVKEGLPNIMESIIEKGEPDPQILFLGIGDHECDSSPLQVGQFESSDELLDKWLTDVYLEGGGGGNYGESYLLAWYFAAYHTVIDCYEKRGKKGFLFTVGDEPCLKKISKGSVKGIMGDGQYDNFSASVLYDKAREKYNVYHIHVKETGAGSRQETIDGWKQLLSDNLLVVEHHDDIADIISNTVLENGSKVNSQVDTSKEEMIL